jgi:hypothetical protein
MSDRFPHIPNSPVGYVVWRATVFFVKAFWRRLISSLFTIRPISDQEIIAIVLMKSVIFAT